MVNQKPDLVASFDVDVKLWSLSTSAKKKL
jgi:hypothetical protein